MTPIIIPECDQFTFFSSLLNELQIIYTKQRFVIRKINYISHFRITNASPQFLISTDPANPVTDDANPSLYLFYIQIKYFHVVGAPPLAMTANGWSIANQVSYQQHAWFPDVGVLDTTIYDDFEEFNGYDGVEIPVTLLDQVRVTKVGVPVTNLSAIIDGYILYLQGGY